MKASWNPANELANIPGYQVEAVLGRGGMGIVYKARHLRLNRAVVRLRVQVTSVEPVGFAGGRLIKCSRPGV